MFDYQPNDLQTLLYLSEAFYAFVLTRKMKRDNILQGDNFLYHIVLKKQWLEGWGAMIIDGLEVESVGRRNLVSVSVQIELVAMKMFWYWLDLKRKFKVLKWDKKFKL